MAAVRLEAVRKVYPNGHVAVAGATFDAAEGELLVLVGPSGCGKSTLLPAPQGTTLASEVLVGVRPEDLVLAPDGAGALEAKLEVVEPVGNEIFLNLRHDDRAIVMRVPPQALPETGSTLRIAIRPGRVHFFDAKTERRIDAP
jgi:ABC-type sugar transport system ATPase subunit